MSASALRDIVTTEAWEQELFARHRWGDPRHGERVITEHAHLRAIWNIIPAASRPPAGLLEQILALEICNWNLENSVIALCQAIGANEPCHLPIGHLASCTDERWKKIWAYYLALLDWLPQGEPGGIRAMQEVCDPDGTVAEHVADLLGERTPRKELYVERFCLTLQYWLRGQQTQGPEGRRGLEAATAALDAQLQTLEPDQELLRAMSLAGSLYPCHHKLFRRYAIILSSIGMDRWRGAMPAKGDGPAERLRTTERLLQPIEAWLSGIRPHDDPFAQMIAQRLGDHTPTKRFLASLLLSLLRAQERRPGE